MLHNFALAPGDDVNRINAGGQTQFLTDGGVLSIHLSNVLLVFVYKFHILI